MQPNALTDIFGLTVDYAGTRAGAAGGVGPPCLPRRPRPRGRSKTMTGAEAWLTLIGNTLTGKIDGEVIFEHYRKDGTLGLMEGSELTKGKWTLEGEKVCFKYPDEDKDCQTISRTGDEVTFNARTRAAIGSRSSRAIRRTSEVFRATSSCLRRSEAASALAQAGPARS